MITITAACFLLLSPLGDVEVKRAHWIKTMIRLLIAFCMLGYLFNTYVNTSTMQSEKLAKPAHQIITVPVKYDTIVIESTYPGKIISPQYTKLHFAHSGVIGAIHCRDNQQVSAGDLICELVNDYEKAQCEGIEIEYREAQRKLAHIESLHKDGLASESDVATRRKEEAILHAKLKQSQAQLRQTQIIAPYDGVLGLIDSSINVGTLYTSQHATCVVDITTNNFETYVEYSAPQYTLYSGRLVVSDNNNREYSARPVTHGQSLENTARLKIRGIIDQKANLLPGSLVKTTHIQENKCVCIPISSVKFLGSERHMVYVVKNNVCVPTPVLLGVKNNELVEVKGGLAVNDVIVLNANMANSLSGILVEPCEDIAL